MERNDFIGPKRNDEAGDSTYHEAALTAGQLDRALSELAGLRHDAEERWRWIRDRLDHVDAKNLNSARNLIHYLSLRRHDIRALQNNLARNGISSLGRSESHVMSNLDTVMRMLHGVVGRAYDPPPESALSLDEGAMILAERTAALLGSGPKHRKVRIMVTLPSEAADDYDLVRDLVAAGMDCARINCAHDSSRIWQRMADNVARAKKETGRDCRICFDIAGPKLRTGAFEPGPQVLKLRPIRDILGRVVAPATVLATPREDLRPEPPNATAHLTLPADFIRTLGVGTKIKFKDARGSARKLKVIRKSGNEVWLETKKTAYIVPETEFKIRSKSGHGMQKLRATAGPLPALEQFARLYVGDTLILTRSQALGKPAKRDAMGNTMSVARVACTLREAFVHAKPGERVWFDDGKLGGIISSVEDDQMKVLIDRAGPNGHRLGCDKGINLPDTKLKLPALTDTDRENLKFIVGHADLIGYSFVRSAGDVQALKGYLRELGAEHLNIILKVETRAAFENLPELLLASLDAPTVGVMIARGDLAVEAGFERMAELQEEILWMCEAAHVPVIWATQVLEQLSKNGVYSRAEITDAAMSERAECVMLNKGPYVLDAVRTLDNVLKRMQAHQEKKRSMMRPLKLAEKFFAKEENRLGSGASASGVSRCERDPIQ